MSKKLFELGLPLPEINGVSAYDKMPGIEARPEDIHPWWARLPLPVSATVFCDPLTGRLRFIDVEGRVAGADTITVTRNEILTSLNKPDDYILAIVEFLDGGDHRVHYIRRPFRREPDFGVTSVNYALEDLLARAEEPR